MQPLVVDSKTLSEIEDVAHKLFMETRRYPVIIPALIVQALHDVLMRRGFIPQFEVVTHA